MGRLPPCQLERLHVATGGRSSINQRRPWVNAASTETLKGLRELWLAMVQRIPLWGVRVNGDRRGPSGRRQERATAPKSTWGGADAGPTYSAWPARPAPR